MQAQEKAPLTDITPQMLIQQARDIAPLLQSKAREAEIARRPLDEVIDAVRETDLFSMMVPKRYGGLETDLDTFFEVVLTLARADASMGWLIGFYIEHAFWFSHFPQEVQDEIFGDERFILAPATLNPAGGMAEKVDGGYRLSGQWAWGTGILHATWVMAGCLMKDENGGIVPMFFVLPREDVEAIDTWHIDGMCATGSWDFKVDDKFVPEARARQFLDVLYLQTGITDRYEAPLYKTPLVSVLSFAASLPCLGAAQSALAAIQEQTKAKLEAGGPEVDSAKLALVAEAALDIEAAELMMRAVLADVLAQRTEASIECRGKWLARMAHAVFMCRDATAKIGSAAGASGHMLDNPIQRALRDINTAACHVIFNRETRMGDYGRALFGQPITSPLV